MPTLTKLQIDALTVDEKLKLIDDLWESFKYPSEVFSPPEWHRELLDRRIEESDRFPEKSIPWETAKAELAKKWLS